MTANALLNSVVRVFGAIVFLVIVAMPADSNADRPKSARLEKAQILGALFKSVGMTYPPQEVYLRAFKHEAQLELWARNDSKSPYSHIKTYPICMSSGSLGPKRRQGDGQVPEGVYKINIFNPQSNYYLSMGINYPNESDRILSDQAQPGGDIFIHGNCVSIGCIPITDDGIKELYIIAYDAYRRIHHVPVHIFPAKMTAEAMKTLQQKAAGQPALWTLWQDLEVIYTEFEHSRRVPVVRVDSAGRYVVVKPNPMSPPQQD